MKVKDRYWEAENSIPFANPEEVPIQPMKGTTIAAITPAHSAGSLTIS